jgi:DNA polymerase III alpha subunit
MSKGHLMAVLNIDEYEDVATWDLIGEGKTKGVFQLESNLGATWAKRTRPKNIEELADLISIIRPGTLEAKLDGKSMTQHYVDRKWKIDETKYLHPALEPLLNKTYGIIVYQEQAMKIATALAGFTPEEADSLRKAMGKKDAALMQEVRKKFVTGCQNQKILTDTDAAQVFDWIQASARYSFNKSHAVAYAINAFRSAYCKTHDPLKFYEVYLNYTHTKTKHNTKQMQIKNFVMDAKYRGIEVIPPRLDFLHMDFTKDDKKNVIYYGYSHIKNVGDGEKVKIDTAIAEAIEECEKPLSQFNWLECLFFIGNKVKKNAFISLISAGALTGNCNKKSRNGMLFEHGIWEKLTAKEQEWIMNRWRNNKKLDMTALFKDMINLNEKINSRRITSVLDLYQALEDPPYSIEDDYSWIADIEYKLMGCSLTCSKVDMLASDDVNISCADIATGAVKSMKNACLAIRVNEVKEYTLTKGQSIGRSMGFVSGEDSSGELDSITLFADEFEQNKKLLFSGNTVLLFGEVQEKKDKSFVVKKVFQI